MASSQTLASCCHHYLHKHRKPTSLSAKFSGSTNFKVNKHFMIISCSSSKRFEAKTGSATEVQNKKEREQRRLRILIAGGGIAGLVVALAAKRRGFDVMVFEKDLSAVRGEGRHRGPIQLLSSALVVLEAIDKNVAKKVMEVGCVTGNRISGLADGISGNWLAQFDLRALAIQKGLPMTTVICRMALQEILLNAVGGDIVMNKSKVVGFSQDSRKVLVTLDDQRQYEGDILVGADGIWSNVRKKLFGAQEASYSGYTCYSGLVDYVPPYINSIGYRVFLGSNKYFVASDIGNGKMQWYGFNKEPRGSVNPPSGKKRRLMELFGSWCSEVRTLISQTQEEMIYRRDIYDRDMIYSWGVGRVTMLGDAAHPMQPNFGLGGCMAIEDSYQLILELKNVKKSEPDAFKLYEISSALKRYEQKRMLRTSVVHAVTRRSSTTLAVYAYLASTAWLPLQLILQLFMTWLLIGHGLW